jgi:hypothetical protein
MVKSEWKKHTEQALAKTLFKITGPKSRLTGSSSEGLGLLSSPLKTYVHAGIATL